VHALAEPLHRTEDAAHVPVAHRREVIRERASRRVRITVDGQGLDAELPRAAEHEALIPPRPEHQQPASIRIVDLRLSPRPRRPRPLRLGHSDAPPASVYRQET